MGRGGAGRGPGARRRPRRRLGAPHGRGEPLSGSRRFACGREGGGRWEGGGGFLHVPFSRMRGKSLPEDMENTMDRDSLYLLKQFDIQGRKVDVAKVLLFFNNENM